jgi:hypothetical protein
MSTAATSNNTFKITIVKAVVAVVGILAVAGFAIVALLAVKDSAEVAAPAPAPAGIAEAGGELQALTAPAEVDNSALISAADAEFNAKSDKVVAARVSRDAVALAKAAGWQDNDAESADAESAKVALATATDVVRDASAAYRDAAKGADVTVSDAHKAVSDAYETAYRATDSDARASADADVTAKRLEFNAAIGA